MKTWPGGARLARDAYLLSGVTPAGCPTVAPTFQTQHDKENQQMTQATTSPLAARLAALEYTGRRHAENLDGLRRTAAHYQSEIPRFDAEIAKLTESLAHVPPSTDSGVDGTYQIKYRIIVLERDRDKTRHEHALLEPQIAEAVALIEENTAAIKTLKAATGL